MDDFHHHKSLSDENCPEPEDSCRACVDTGGSLMEMEDGGLGVAWTDRR